MKAPQFYTTVALSGICLVLTIASIALGQSSRRLQTEFQRQQQEIAQGQNSLQIGQNIVRDLAQVSLKNEKIKQVLARNGYTVNVNPAATPAQ